MARELDEHHRRCDLAGCHSMAACARELNRIIDFAHTNRLTRHQQVMFALADMATHVEVGDAMARLAVEQADAITLASARIFANACAGIVADKIRLIVMGTAGIDPDTGDAFLQSADQKMLTGTYRGLIDDMDCIADHIFERAS